MTTNINNPQTPAFKNAYEYADRWRKKHDAMWIAGEVWNKVHDFGQPWQGFLVEDFRLTPEEAAFYLGKMDAAVAAEQQRIKWQEESKLADEAHEKVVAAFEQS